MGSSVGIPQETWISLCAVPIGRHTKLKSSRILIRKDKTLKDKGSVSRHNTIINFSHLKIDESDHNSYFEVRR